MTGRTTIGMILRLRELGESDLLVDLYTGPMGRLTAIAKGARRSQKRFFGLLLVGHLIEAQLVKGKSGDLWRLDSAKVVHTYAPLRAQWSRWLFAAPVLELLLRITAAHDPSEGLLSLADNTLQRICSLKEQRLMASSLLIFTVVLVQKLGFGLSFEYCVRCGQRVEPSDNIRLSLEGGVVCSQCPAPQNCHTVPQGLVKGMSAARDIAPDQRGRLAFPLSVGVPGLRFMTDYLQTICGRDIQSLGVLLDDLPK